MTAPFSVIQYLLHQAVCLPIVAMPDFTSKVNLEKKGIMQVDLNKNELELLDKALILWEQEPLSGFLSGLMVSTMLSRGNKEELHREAESNKAEAEKECFIRRRTSILIRAKLIQAANKESEHDVG